jgi:hypothetical protein
MILVPKPTFLGSKVLFKELNGVLEKLNSFDMISNAKFQPLYSKIWRKELNKFPFYTFEFAQEPKHEQTSVHQRSSLM